MKLRVKGAWRRWSARRFDSISDWWPPVLAGLAALALYAATLAPGLTWAHDGADGGDLLAAALTRGVPHPSGYPVYQMLLAATLAILPGEPARIGNWLSAVCAAAAVALLGRLACRTLPPGRWRRPIALAVALAWATTPALWSQAVITEVYALNALFATLLLWLLWRWRETRTAGQASSVSWGPEAGQGWLVAAAFTAGLGLGNHLTLALLLPAAATWLWGGRARGSIGAVAGMAARVALAFLAGLSVYIYLPLAARGGPPANWGDPQTSARLWWLVSGQIYRPLLFGVETAYLPGRLAAWAGEGVRQFGGPWWLAVALIGLWRVEIRDRAWWGLTILVVLALSVYAIGYNTPDSYVYLIPAWGVVALWIGEGLAFGITAAGRAFRGAARAAPRAAAVAVLVLLPVVAALRFWPQMDLSREREAQDFVAAVMAEAAPGATVLTASDGPTFALWYARYGLGRRPDLTPVNVNLLGFSWYRETLARHHPSWEIALTGDRPPDDQWDSAFVGRFLAGLAGRVPLYSAEPLDLEAPGVVLEPVGTLTRWRWGEK